MNIPMHRVVYNGLALVEVLITAALVGIGFLGLAAIQTELVKSSADDKIRGAAQALALAKVEALRASADEAGYDAIQSSGTPELFSDIGGVPETLERSWTIADETAPLRKEVRVRVCWPFGCTSDVDADPEKLVVVQTAISRDSLSVAGLAMQTKSGSAAGAASTNANSSDDITEREEILGSQVPGGFSQSDQDTRIVTVDDIDYLITRVIGEGEGGRAIGVRVESCVNPELLGSCDDADSLLADFEGALKTRRVNCDGVSGRESIELFEVITREDDGVDKDYCIPRIRFNGGVIIKLRGTVYSRATAGSGSNETLLDVDLFAFNASESGAYCVFDPQPGATSAPYVCYVGGNCKGTNCDESICNDADVSKCPDGAHAAAIVGEGGWRGKIGLLGIAGSSSDFFNVCFAEELASAPETLDSAREYYTRRNGINEGLNRHQDCHDFLIIDGQSNEAKIHAECEQAISEIQGSSTLASKLVQRIIESGDNLFDPVVDVSNCVGSVGIEYLIQGEIRGASNAPIVNLSDGVSILSCNATLSSYSCSVVTSRQSVTISGLLETQAVSCILSPMSTDGCTLEFPVGMTYVFVGNVIGSPAFDEAAVLRLQVVDGNQQAVDCVIDGEASAESRSYRCGITTDDTTGLYISARADSGYLVTPELTNPSLDGCTPDCAGGDFTLSEQVTYQVSGFIDLDKSNVDNITEVGVSVLSGSCSLTAPNGGWKKDTRGAYVCEFNTGTNSLTFNISPTCSDSKSGNQPTPKKYLLKAGSEEALGGGHLVVELHNQNTTINLVVTESLDGCSD